MRRKSPPRKQLLSPIDSNVNINLLFIATLVLIAFAIYLGTDTSALYTFLGAALAYLFGRRSARQ